MLDDSANSAVGGRRSQRMNDDDGALRDLLRTLSPSAREHFREVLIQDQADRDAIASELMRYRDERGDDWADIIDMLTMHREAWRNAVRLFGKIEAAATS
jgi:hypothetical protein